MADRQETIADIIAEMRFHGQQNIDAEKDKPEHGFLTVEGRSIQSYADRLEAAHRRERGNSAALREALEEAENGLFRWQSGSMNRAGHRELIAKIKTALAAPPRNCDIYLTEEAVDAATVTVRDCEACPRVDMEAPCVFCMVRWLLAPATEKEGGAK